MLKLSSSISLDKETISAPNLADRFDERDLQAIGNFVYEGYERDEGSRSRWIRRSEAAMDLALQLQKAKTFPWPGCSNVAFPLVTIGALQFHAKAYPTLIQGTEVVKMRVVGEDPDGKKTARARRVSTHMSYQVLEEDQSWEEQHDRLFLNYSVVGTAFVKTFHSNALDHNVSELVLARDLVLDYYAKSLESCPRITHLIPYTRNAIRERVMDGTFRDVLGEGWYQAPQLPERRPEEASRDTRRGIQPPATPDEQTPFIGLEQHVDLDLDQDGYAEPYIITIEKRSRAVLRIVTAFDNEEDITRVQVGRHRGEIISIQKNQHFTKYGFIPSPDGGIYDLGFGILLGPLNESVNTIINQMIDAGSFSLVSGGFLGRGAKLPGGVVRARPFEWTNIGGTAEDLQKSIVPFPKNEPSAVLFQLLGLLIDYVNRISGATDAVVGINPGQNTPAQTQQSMVEMGMKIYTAIFKRTWRSMKEEFKKLYILNARYLPEGRFGKAQRSDYTDDPNAIVPSADPNIVSEQMQQMQAKDLYALAKSEPGFVMPSVVKRVLSAMRVEAPDEVYKPESIQPPAPDVKLQIEQLRQQGAQARMKMDHLHFILEMQQESQKMQAEILELEAKANLEIVQAGDAKTNQIIALFNAQVGAMKAHHETLARHIENALKEKEIEQRASESGGVGGVAGSSGDSGTATVGAEAA
jgi:chaperonin GroES